MLASVLISRHVLEQPSWRRLCLCFTQLTACLFQRWLPSEIWPSVSQWVTKLKPVSPTTGLRGDRKSEPTQYSQWGKAALFSPFPNSNGALIHCCWTGAGVRCEHWQNWEWDRLEGGDDSVFFIDHKAGLQAVVFSCCSEFFCKSETRSLSLRHLIHCNNEAVRPNSQSLSNHCSQHHGCLVAN